MKKIYAAFCKFEELVALLLLAGLTVLVFVSALMRYIKMPLNWAQDVALVAFAWMIFLGSDIAIRVLGVLGVNGYSMTVTGWSRQITALHISYSWVTMAVPVGALLMIISTTIRLVERIKTPADQEIKYDAGKDVA